MKLRDEIAIIGRHLNNSIDRDIEIETITTTALRRLLDFHDKAVAALRETEAITHSHGECGIACRTIARKVLALLDKEVE